MLLKKLKENFLFAVIRGHSTDDAIKIAEASVAGGIFNLEITYTTPDASAVIKHLSQKYQTDPNVIVGAGTVLTPTIAKEAIAAGAKFIVSPHFSKAINEVCHAEDTLYFPGCMTPTEVITALQSGIKLIKIFPGGVLGPDFIKNLRGPLPDVELMPSGGVDHKNLKVWCNAGVSAVGLGNTLVSGIETKGYPAVTQNAQAFVGQIKEL